MKTRTIAVLLAATLATVAHPIADAAVVTGNYSGLPVENIETGRTVQLTIYKTAPNPFNDVPAGELPPGGVAGATFTVERLGGYDLTDAAVWDTFPALDISDTETAEILDAYTAVTDASGNAVFQALPQGLYRVKETAPDDPSKDYRVSAPFLITLPVADTEGSSWAYEVTITPKNKPHQPPPGSSGSSGGVIPIPIPVPGDGHSSSGSSTGTTAQAPQKPETPVEKAKQPTKGIAKYLPNTGADVLMLTLVGAVLMLLGLALLRRRRNNAG
ncbi:SpaH/EbpB family LPXTG-anchored major pilin [Corynebacterium pygosceleis]|uniref:SpaH/EbpB family LPXTG-anchored major pilin n=1 Tax=Corynebacterium pygosceleis TaxID=2800406 RepID=UPI001904FBAD|nr:SpaH/EbpB family LPXTG-anchored major pilin [Corynebacterium pygosceleis]MCK7675999.1 SpaH/EbpB family LPXTG-anchored major pilin [Corynebacterium pygosceleis]MCL0119875.1 SpaH/EbpB family LPXTG-anchored major pilin [Corynebacterium pygosceleis]